MSKALYLQVREYNEEEKAFWGNFWDEIDTTINHSRLGIPEMPPNVGQMELILPYLDNPHIQRALDGEESLSETVERLSSVNKGLRMFLPRRRDEDHYQELQDLKPLIGEMTEYEKHGAFIPDNVLTVLAYAVPCVMLVQYIAHGETPFNYSENLFPVGESYWERVIPVSLVTTTIFGGMINLISRFPKEDYLERAQSIDTILSYAETSEDIEEFIYEMMEE